MRFVADFRSLYRSLGTGTTSRTRAAVRHNGGWGCRHDDSNMTIAVCDRAVSVIETDGLLCKTDGLLCASQACQHERSRMWMKSDDGPALLTCRCVF